MDKVSLLPESNPPSNPQQYLKVQESVVHRYIGTFELIEDPNSSGIYYEGPY